jgi:hypothetical protein
MAVTYGAQGTAGNGTTNADLTYPTGISASTSELFAIVCGRCSVADTAWAAPTGWTSVGQFEGGTGTFGVDTGTRRVAFFRKNTVTGSETGTVNFAFGAGANTSTTTGAIFRVVKTAGFTVTAQFASGADTTNGTAFSATSSTSLNWATGDLLCIGVAQNIDSGTRSSISVSATGVTFGTRVAQIDIAVTTGNDVRRILDTVPVSSASTTAAATYSHTISAAGSGPVAFLVLTETAVDISTALVGSGITAGQGSMSVPRSSGQVATFDQGSVSAVDTQLALTGEAITSAQGTASANADGTVGVTGSASTSAQETIAPTLSKALTGEAVTAAQGSVAVVRFPTNINFPTLTASAGTLVAVGDSAVTVHISGEEFTATTGNVDSGGQATTGSAATFAAGTAVANLTKALTGEGIASEQGLLTIEQLADDTYIASAQGSATGSVSAALVGEAATGGQGTFEITGDDSADLTGEASTSAAGTATPALSLPLSGQQVDTAQYNVGAPGGASLTGEAVTVSTGEVFTVNDRTYELTGQSMTVQQGDTSASSLAFPAGEEFTASIQDIGPRNVELTGESIASDTGRVVGEGPQTGKPAGRGKGKGKPDRHAIEIDGEVFTVRSPEEAVALLQQAKEAAQEQAALALERANKAEKRPARKVLADAREALTVPEIVAPDDVSELVQEIETIYKDALQAVEISVLMRKAEEAEEEDEEAALLMLIQ